ncbi:MAG: HEAT repeat domain-containing protein [Planctomycetes bacterium]|nr:HEAT repeat domain-containing protein [Planctomycetota bacterium]
MFCLKKKYLLLFIILPAFCFIATGAICLALSALGTECLAQVLNEQISPSDWDKIKASFTRQYASKLPQNRIEAINLITPCWFNFTSPKSGKEAVMLLVKVLEEETAKEVVAAAINCLYMASYDNESADTLIKQCETAKNETTRLRLIETLGRFVGSQDKAVASLSAMAKDKNVKIRLAVIEALKKLPAKHTLSLLISLISDAEKEISFAVIAHLAATGDYDIVPQLIELTGTEKREDVKKKILQALESIVGKNYGNAQKEWQEWWKEREKSKVSQEEIDKAIDKAKNYLLDKAATNITATNECELTFYALLHAGCSPDTPVMKSALQHILTKQLAQTYNVALIALVLSDLDKVKYQARIAQCAMWLLGNESKQGNWHYGTALPDKDMIAPTITGNDKKKPEKDKYAKNTKKTMLKIKVPPRQQRDPNSWDNSNTQYAILGLWACAKAGIEIPKEAWQDAEANLLRSQSADGGWSYQAAQGTGHGSMTAGGLAALVICMQQLGKKTSDNRAIKNAKEWLGKNFTVKENPKYGESWHYYYLYALERAGVLSETDFFANNDWYQIGAKYLLGKQKKNGSWDVQATWDTCFAVLFLRRATKFAPPLKATVTGDEKPKEVEKPKETEKPETPENIEPPEDIELPEIPEVPPEPDKK